MKSAKFGKTTSEVEVQGISKFGVRLYVLGVEYFLPYEEPAFTWGSETLAAKGNARDNYISALKKADAGNIEHLLKFAKS